MRLDGPRGGETFVHEFDFKRLNKQMRRVFVAMVSGEWRTLGEIAAQTKDPEASVSARLRDFRKPKFGTWIVKRRRRGDPSDGLFEYRLQRRKHDA